MLNPNHIFPQRKALEIVDELNSDPEDDWTYKVVPLSDKNDWFYIMVYDEDGIHVGTF